MKMKRICIAFNGLLNPNIVLSVISVSAATAVLSWNERKFWMLWKIDLPSSTAGRMVLKLSSTRIIEAASFATSVPDLPIEIPMSEDLSAGASLTLGLSC